MTYPDVEKTIELLTAAAQRAARENNLWHPEDIASAMITAIEVAAPVIQEAYQNFKA